MRNAQARYLGQKKPYLDYHSDIAAGIEHGFLYNICNRLLLITKNYTYNLFYINTPHTDGYNLKLHQKEFDRKI